MQDKRNETMTARIVMSETAARSSSQVVVERKISPAALLYNSGLFRKTFIIAALALMWQLYAQTIDNPLVFPSFSETISTLVDRTLDGTIPLRAATSLRVLLIGYFIGIVLAGALTMIAISTRLGSDLLETLTAMFNPLPAIALLPLALIWFGLGAGSIVFVLVHSVLWAVSLNTHTGFLAVSQTLRMVGRNYGLRGLPYVTKILIPAAFPSILTGLKIGWAFAWRTLIAAELVFGVASGQGGLGWYIYENRNVLDIPAVFAGLLTVIIIGLVVENLIFANVERHTVIKWGLQA
jgi:NitT/TauT family transport system permease protein